MHEWVGQTWHLKNFYCPNSLGISWDAKNILKNFFYKALKRKILSTHISFFQVFFALSGKTGEILWGFENHIIKSDLMSVFVAQFIDDLDGDGVQEVLAVHGGDELSDPGMGQKKY